MVVVDREKDDVDGRRSVDILHGDFVLPEMESELKFFEIVKFKSITNRGQLIDLCIIGNVVFVAFDINFVFAGLSVCRLIAFHRSRIDLVAAIEYVFVKKIRMREGTDMIIAVKREPVADKRLQRLMRRY